ncbi:MAG TPA: hypothetical protein VN805_09015 [Caulobacteraceae bacterium]|nr:hypothetical protein [Caulobacteraceae bacterium]
MRRFARVLLLASAAIFLMAASAGDQVHRPLLVVPQNPPVPAGLRGPQAVPPPSPPPSAPQLALAPPAASAIQPAVAHPPSRGAAPAAPNAAATDAEPCRLACAQPYYFCLAGENAATCPDAWRRCVAACDMPIEPDGAVAPPASATATAAR